MIRSARPPPCPPLENRKKREFLKNEGGSQIGSYIFWPPHFLFFHWGGAKKCKLGGRENVTYIFWRGGPPYLFVTYIFWPPPKKSCPRGWGCQFCTFKPGSRQWTSTASRSRFSLYFPTSPASWSRMPWMAEGKQVATTVTTVASWRREDILAFQELANLKKLIFWLEHRSTAKAWLWSRTVKITSLSLSTLCWDQDKPGKSLRVKLLGTSGHYTSLNYNHWLASPMCTRSANISTATGGWILWSKGSL